MRPWLIIPWFSPQNLLYIFTYLLSNIIWMFFSFLSPKTQYDNCSFRENKSCLFLSTQDDINRRKWIPLDIKPVWQHHIWVEGTDMLVELDCKWKTLNTFCLFIGWASSKVPQQTILPSFQMQNDVLIKIHSVNCKYIRTYIHRGNNMTMI